MAIINWAGKWNGRGITSPGRMLHQCKCRDRVSYPATLLIMGSGFSSRLSRINGRSPSPPRIPCNGASVRWCPTSSFKEPRFILGHSKKKGGGRNFHGRPTCSWTRRKLPTTGCEGTRAVLRDGVQHVDLSNWLCCALVGAAGWNNSPTALRHSRSAIWCWCRRGNGEVDPKRWNGDIQIMENPRTVLLVIVREQQ